MAAIFRQLWRLKISPYNDELWSPCNFKIVGAWVLYGEGEGPAANPISSWVEGAEAFGSGSA